MRTWPAGWRVEAEKKHQTTPWVWLWDLPLHIDGSLQLRAALTHYREPITLSGVVYQPWPIEMEELDESGEGDLPTLTLSIGNRPRLLAPYLEEPGPKKGLLGKEIIIRFANLDLLPHYWEFRYECRHASLTNEALLLTLEPPNYLQHVIPEERYTSLCRHPRFGRGACPYVINQHAAYTTCPRTFAACEARGADMRTRVLGDVLPEAYGGFFGLSR